MQVKHSSQLGPLEVPALGRSVAAGEVVTVTAVLGKSLCEQTDLWQAVPKAEEAAK